MKVRMLVQHTTVNGRDAAVERRYLGGPLVQPGDVFRQYVLHPEERVYTDADLCALAYQVGSLTRRRLSDSDGYLDSGLRLFSVGDVLAIEGDGPPRPYVCEQTGFSPLDPEVYSSIFVQVPIAAVLGEGS